MSITNPSIVLPLSNDSSLTSDRTNTYTGVNSNITIGTHTSLPMSSLFTGLNNDSIVYSGDLCTAINSYSDLTISVKFIPTVANVSQYIWSLSRNSSSASDLTLVATNNTLVYRLRTTSATYFSYAIPNIFYANQLYHIVCSCGTGGSYISINGVVYSTLTYITGGLLANTHTPKWIKDNTIFELDRFCIGVNVYSNGLYRYPFNGYIKDLIIDNTKVDTQDNVTLLNKYPLSTIVSKSSNNRTREIAYTATNNMTTHNQMLLGYYRKILNTTSGCINTLRYKAQQLFNFVGDTPADIRNR